MRNPSGGHGQGRTVDRNPLDGFVREQLAGTLMKMQPRRRRGGRSGIDAVFGRREWRDKPTAEAWLLWLKVL